MKLGKTAIQLIKSASFSHNTFCVDTSFSTRNCKTYGYRSRNAAQSLIKAGLAKLVNSHSGISYTYGGRSDHYTSRVYELTEAGIALKASM